MINDPTITSSGDVMDGLTYLTEELAADTLVPLSTLVNAGWIQEGNPYPIPPTGDAVAERVRKEQQDDNHLAVEIARWREAFRSGDGAIAKLAQECLDRRVDIAWYEAEIERREWEA